MVIERDSWSRGCEFESRHRTLQRYCFSIIFDWSDKIINKNVINIDFFVMGVCNSSVDSSAPTILQYWVRIPCTTSMPVYSQILINWQKRGWAISLKTVLIFRFKHSLTKGNLQWVEASGSSQTIYLLIPVWVNTNFKNRGNLAH